MTGGQSITARATAGLATVCLVAGCAASRPAATATLPGTAAVRSRIARADPARSHANLSSPKIREADSAPGGIKLTAHEIAPEEPPEPVASADTLSLAAADPAQASDVSPATSHPISLETALQLTSGQNPQVAFARERIQEAFAQLDRAKVLWLPSVRAGVTYDKHEGPAQAVDGIMLPGVSRSALFGGFGGVTPGAATPAIPGLYANFQIVDAIFQPRIAELTAAARKSAAMATTNDALLNAALAHLELLRAGQDLAISREATRHTQDLVDLTDNYAKTGKGTEADHDRALAELAVRKDDIETNVEAIHVASARLAQQLNLDP